MGLSEDEYRPAPESTYWAVRIHGWVSPPGHLRTVPDLGAQAPAREWISWVKRCDRQLRARVLEWVLMDPARGAVFLTNDMDFRRTFCGYYTSVVTTLVHLRALEPKTPMFFLEKIEKVWRALEEEEWLTANQLEVKARERRVEYLRSTLDHGCEADWDEITGFESQETIKKGEISDLLYNRVQEEDLAIQCSKDSRTVCYTVERSPRDDRRQAVIDAALDEQALDLCGNHERDQIDANVSMEEAS